MCWILEQDGNDRYVMLHFDFFEEEKNKEQLDIIMQVNSHVTHSTHHLLFIRHIFLVRCQNSQILR